MSPKCFLALCLAPGLFSAEIVLVKEGRPAGAIVLAEGAGAACRSAARDLQHHLRLASGATVPIVEAADARTAPSARVVIGPGTGLAPEEYELKTEGTRLLISGSDAGGSPGPLYAVSYLLDRHLGVRWLWPGEAGTYVPKRATIALPALHVRARPALVERRLRLPRGLDPSLAEEVNLWLAHHLMGSRSEYRFGHSFGQWHKKYHQEHADYFAHAPEGQERFWLPERLKLCVSNPAVADRVIEEWKAAGMPASWNVGPNDGKGFCVCERCRALDVPPTTDLAAVWGGTANLTGRYVAFWNGLIKRMRALRPDAQLTSYAYSAYREPPAGPLAPGIVLQVVHHYHAYDAWRGWSKAGVRLMLRPNWFHMAAVAPHMPLHAAGDYFRFARDNGMVGFHFDSLMGYWGTQGPYYYLIARLSARPDLGVDEVIAEYASAFGKAAPAIRDYLAYWEKFSTEAAYTAPAGGSQSTGPNSRYEAICKQYRLPEHPLQGGWRTLPYLLTDETLAPARALLDRAASLEADPAVRARIQFFRDGLQHLEMTRDVIGLAYSNPLPKGVSKEEYVRRIRELHEYRRQLTPRHVVWGDHVTGTMRYRGIRPEAGDKRVDLTAM